MHNGKVPKPTLERLATYLRLLIDLDQSNVDTISSADVERQTGINAAQFRKDLSYFGEFGKPGVGYNVNELQTRIARILKIDREQRVILVGAGNLGSALVGYPGLQEHRFNLVAVFDNNFSKIGRPLWNLEILDMGKIKELNRDLGARIAILAVPSVAAQRVTELLVDAGIHAILNFAPVLLRVPDHVYVRNVSFVQELAVLSYHLTGDLSAEFAGLISGQDVDDLSSPESAVVEFQQSESAGSDSAEVGSAAGPPFATDLILRRRSADVRPPGSRDCRNVTPPFTNDGLDNDKLLGCFHMSTLYPVHLNIEGRLCVVVGGGGVAERKARALLEAGARVRLVSPDVTPGILELASSQRLEWIRARYSNDHLAGAHLGFAATNIRSVNAQVGADCAALSVLVNIADDPASADFVTPSIVRRGDLCISIETGGSQPLLTARLARQISDQFDPGYGSYVALLGSVRGWLKDEIKDPDRRKSVMSRLLDNEEEIRRIAASAAPEEAETLIRQMVARIAAEPGY